MSFISSQHIKFIIITNIGFAMEALAVYLTVTGFPASFAYGALIVLALHFISSFIVSWTFYKTIPEKKKLALLIFTLLFILPLIGYITIVQILLTRGKKQDISYFREYRDYLLNSGNLLQEDAEIGESYKNLGEGFQVEPVKEALIDANYFQKLGIIKNISKIPGKDSVIILKNFLEDSHMDIRYYAGEEIAKNIDMYNIFINELREEVEKDPINYRLYTQMGRLLIEYAFSGLLEEAERNDELSNALEALEKSLDFNPNQYEANLLTGRIHATFQEYSTALEYFTKAASLKKNDFAAIAGIAECYWEKMDFENFEVYVKILSKLNTESSPEQLEKINEMIELWRETDAEEVHAG